MGEDIPTKDGKPVRFRLKIPEDKAKVIIEFLPASGATGEVALDFDQLTALIQGLGNARMHVHAHPAPSLEGVEIAATYDPRWWIQPEPLTEGSAVMFYHPAYGRLGFVIPRDEVEAIVRHLSIHLGIPPADKTKPN